MQSQIHKTLGSLMSIRDTVAVQTTAGACDLEAGDSESNERDGMAPQCFVDVGLVKLK